jgi:Phage integrase, N-terminal SAM-like domain
MTARRRGKGEGSIYRRASDGRWVAALIMEDGRRVVRRARSRKDAATKLELLLKARAEDQTIAAHQSTSAFLSEWLAVVKNTVAPGTFERYEQYIRVHALPALGRIKLGRLTPQHFQRLYQEKLAAGAVPHHRQSPAHRPPRRLRRGRAMGPGAKKRRGTRPAATQSARRDRRPHRRRSQSAPGRRGRQSVRSPVHPGAASCLPCTGTTSTSTRASCRSTAPFAGRAKGSPSALQRRQHPGARWCCRPPRWRRLDATEHARKGSARRPAICGRTWG